MPHLKQAVSTVLAQTYPRIELIIVENGSTDGTREWLDGLSDPRIRIFHQPELVPVFQNWTTAIELANGEFVKLLCADDFLKPESISRQVAALQANRNAVMAAAKRDICDDWGRTVIRGRGLDGLSEVSTQAEVAAACANAGTNVLGEPHAVMYRTTSVKTEMPWSSHYPYVVDLDMSMRVLGHGDLVAVRSSDSVFRLTSGSWSSRLMHEQASQFAAWMQELAYNSVGLDDRLLARASKRSARNQLARRVVYVGVDARSRMLNRLSRRPTGPL